MSCCQFVSVAQLVILIDRLRHAALSPDERAEHERFLLKCVPSPQALDFVRAPEQHAANPHPGTVPTPEEMARIVMAMR